MLGFFNDFYEKKFMRSLNATFLVLVPKKENAEDLKDLRPISLVGGLYEILGKVIANRLNKAIEKVVSPTQILAMAFVERDK